MPVSFVVLPETSRSPNNHGTVTAPQVMTADLRIGKFSMVSSNWAALPGRNVTVLVEQSIDGGATWTTYLQAIFPTGQLTREGTLPFMSRRDDAGVPDRLIRTTVSHTGGVLNLGLHGEFS